MSSISLIILPLILFPTSWPSCVLYYKPSFLDLQPNQPLQMFDAEVGRPIGIPTGRPMGIPMGRPMERPMGIPMGRPMERSHGTFHGNSLVDRNPQNEGPGFLKSLWPTVVTSGGSKSSKIKGLGIFEPLWPTVVASGGAKSSTREGLGFISLYGRPPLPPASRNLQKMNVFDSSSFYDGPKIAQMTPDGPTTTPNRPRCTTDCQDSPKTAQEAPR